MELAGTAGAPDQSDQYPVSRPARIAAATVAGLLVVVALLGVTAHFRLPHSSNIVGLSAFSPYLMLGAFPAVIIYAALRKWPSLGVAVLVAAIALSTQWRLYIAAPSLPGATAVVAMTANLRLGQADPAAVVRTVRDHDVALLTTEELTGQEQADLIAAGLPSLLPYHVTDPRESASGVGIWSRYPLLDAVRRPDFTFAFVTAGLALPGVRRPPLVVALHMPGPWPQPAKAWVRDIEHLPRVLSALAPGQSVLVGGDFNATPDVAQFRNLLVGGYRDAAQQAGAGMTRTYPADEPLPALIAIDHVLTRGAVARSARTVQISGSDHRALVVTVQVPEN